MARAHLQKPVWVTFSLCEEQGESVEEKRYVHHTPQGGAESLAAFLGGRAGATSLRNANVIFTAVPQKVCFFIKIICTYQTKVLSLQAK